MRVKILLLILIATLFGSGFWYTAFSAPCKIPVTYRIGALDERFNTSPEELQRIAVRAEAMWEERLGTDLFRYDVNGDLPINLVFDERQENAERDAELKEDLESKKGMSEGVAAQYEALIAEFRKQKKTYESRIVSYERSLSEYNTEVAAWNEKGGAPVDVIASLKKRESTLSDEKKKLETLAKDLDAIANRLNAIGARGNSLITDYNTVVREYNERVAEATDFTQGDYVGDAINIYQFDSEDELVIVLAHEFGHALSFDHVEGESSIMYHHMGAQTIDEGISVEDEAMYNARCVEGRTFLRILGTFLGAFRS